MKIKFVLLLFLSLLLVSNFGETADRDGDNDVLIIANSSAAMTVHRNPGNGIFQSPFSVQEFSIC